MKKQFFTRGPVNIRKIFFLSLVLAVAMITSCGKDNNIEPPEPPTPPEPPVVQTVTYTINSMDDLKKAAEEVKSNSLSRIIINVTGNLGLTNESKSLMNTFITWQGWVVTFMYPAHRKTKRSRKSIQRLSCYLRALRTGSEQIPFIQQEGT